MQVADESFDSQHNAANNGVGTLSPLNPSQFHTTASIHSLNSPTQDDLQLIAQNHVAPPLVDHAEFWSDRAELSGPVMHSFHNYSRALRDAQMLQGLAILQAIDLYVSLANTNVSTKRLATMPGYLYQAYCSSIHGTNLFVADLERDKSHIALYQQMANKYNFLPWMPVRRVAQRLDFQIFESILLFFDKIRGNYGDLKKWMELNCTELDKVHEREALQWICSFIVETFGTSGIEIRKNIKNAAVRQAVFIQTKEAFAAARTQHKVARRRIAPPNLPTFPHKRQKSTSTQLNTNQATPSTAPTESIQQKGICRVRCAQEVLSTSAAPTETNVGVSFQNDVTTTKAGISEHEDVRLPDSRFQECPTCYSRVDVQVLKCPVCKEVDPQDICYVCARFVHVECCVDGREQVCTNCCDNFLFCFADE